GRLEAYVDTATGAPIQTGATVVGLRVITCCRDLADIQRGRPGVAQRHALGGTGRAYQLVGECETGRWRVSSGWGVVAKQGRRLRSAAGIMRNGTVATSRL